MCCCFSHRIFYHYEALLIGGDKLVSDINPDTSKSFFFVCGGFFHIRKQLISWGLQTVKSNSTHFSLFHSQFCAEATTRKLSDINLNEPADTFIHDAF